MPAKTKKSKSLVKKHSSQTIAIVVLCAVNILLVGAVAVLAFFISYLWQVQKENENIKITTFILQAHDGLYGPAPVDAKTGDVYIPEVRLVFPKATASLQPIEYSYSPQQDEFAEELNIVNTYGFYGARTAMLSARNLEDTFKEVPRFQGCSRGYRLSFASLNDDSMIFRFTKPLSDGRTLYVYIDKSCNEPSEDQENYFKQADSY